MVSGMRSVEKKPDLGKAVKQALKDEHSSRQSAREARSVRDLSDVLLKSQGSARDTSAN